MPLVKPFRALRFDQSVAGPLDDLVAPPYDVISRAALDALVRKSAYNVVRLIRPHEPELAAKRLFEWLEAGALVREERPALWRIEETYVGPDDVGRTRRGLVARVKLEPYARGVVLPHERIFAAPAESRLGLLRATRTKISPVLMLHDGPTLAPAERPPDLEASLEGTITRLWRIDKPDTIREAQERVRGPLVIADGHHRYESALRFHAEEGTEETGWVMAVVVSHEDPGLTIFPTHRMVTGAVPELNGSLRISRLDADVERAFARLGAVSRDHAAFVLLRADEALLAERTPGAMEPLERLDVAAVDRLLLEGVAYTPFLAEVEAAVESGRASAAFLVRAPTVAEVQAIARSGQTMPEKSTYFYPKLATGLLFSPFDE